ncbi:MAG: DUF1318 domain-containing protein [Candidatus Omnitrophica bacterium]|jgi:uncharacterized protein YdbL (DUF1318 family)|nr:DUF1318 domain-containing protein [Candidatus Omnitrophota bacterium]
MKNRILAATAIFLALLGVGCASVQVKAPKDPIKVDITMRLDVYQHVEKDINTIEDIVSGKSAPKSKDGSKLDLFFTDAYAEEAIPADVEAAAIGRRDRKAELVMHEQEGHIGENRMGMVEARSPKAPGQLVNAENADRMVIYKSISQKNGAALENVEKLYAKRLQEDAPAGTPIEVMDAAGGYSWKIK